MRLFEVEKDVTISITTQRELDKLGDNYNYILILSFSPHLLPSDT